MKKLTALLLAGAMALSLAACGGGGTSSTPDTSAPDASNTDTSTPSSSADTGAYDELEPVSLILADSAAPGAAGAVFDELIAEKAAEITGGKLEIQTYINGELGADVDLLRQMQSGDIDMVGSQIAALVSFCPELAVFDLPMVFAPYTGDQIEEVLNGDSETRAGLDVAFENANWHLLGFLQNATYRLTTANTDLQTLADFEGLMIRTMENSNHMAFWEAIGAAPTPMAWNEVYFALQSGNIAAEENTADTIVGANLNEVQDYLACTNHILYVNQISINKDSWDSLDPAYQEALQEAVNQAIDEMRVQLVDIDTQNKETLVEGGMTMIEYEPEFFEEVLAVPGVQQLYSDINEQTNGLAQTLQDELAAAAA